MPRLAMLVIAAALCALPAATAGGAQPSSPGASAAAKKCGNHKRHHKGRKHRRCKRGQNGVAGGGGGGGSGSGGAASCANTASSPGRVAAFENDNPYTISLSRASVGCGTVILEQNTIQAMDPHNLVLQKEGDPGPSYSYDELGPGTYARQTLNLSRGNWVLYCSLSNHRALGMEVTLVVN
jgi:hypothetical protein